MHCILDPDPEICPNLHPFQTYIIHNSFENKKLYLFTIKSLKASRKCSKIMAYKESSELRFKMVYFCQSVQSFNLFLIVWIRTYLE